MSSRRWTRSPLLHPLRCPGLALRPPLRRRWLAGPRGKPRCPGPGCSPRGALGAVQPRSSVTSGLARGPPTPSSEVPALRRHPRGDPREPLRGGRRGPPRRRRGGIPPPRPASASAPSLGVGASISSAGISPPPPPYTPTHSSPSLLPATPQQSAFAACAAPEKGGVSAFFSLFLSSFFLIFLLFFFFLSLLRSGPFRRSSSSRGHAGAEQGGWPGGASRGCSSSCVSTAAASRDTEPCRDEAGAETDPVLTEHRSCFTATGCPISTARSIATGTPHRDRGTYSSGLGGCVCVCVKVSWQRAAAQRLSARRCRGSPGCGARS